MFKYLAIALLTSSCVTPYGANTRLLLKSCALDDKGTHCETVSAAGSIFSSEVQCRQLASDMNAKFREATVWYFCVVEN
jgi:hypothetical protein